jgi:hypothetical protein
MAAAFELTMSRPQHRQRAKGHRPFRRSMMDVLAARRGC